jgi:type IV pilus assembly protein PilW
MSAAAALAVSRRADRQAGRTLIELMVSVAIALAITAAVASVYVSTSRTARVAGELAGIADGGQVTMQLIGDAIRQAGYGEIVGSELALGAGQVGLNRSQTLFAAGMAVGGCTGARFVDETLETPVCGAAGSANFDTLLVRFQGDAVIPPAQGRIDDCLGGQVPVVDLPAGHPGIARVASRPMIHGVYYGLNGALWCRGNGRATQADPFPAAQQLIGNVEQFKVFYGFDDVRWASPATSVGASTRSLRDAAWINGQDPTMAAWDFVVSVHVCMVVRSDPDAGKGLTRTQSPTYERCPQTAAEAAGSLPQVTATDGALRRTYLQTFTVRGSTPANPRLFMP